jgi:hypothetical protein
MALPVEPSDQARYSSGLYQWLVDREERAARLGGLPWTPEAPSYDGYPDRLAALRAGCALNLPVADLPKHARIGLDTGWVHRATVLPDGTIVLSVDNGRMWAAENGL